MNNNKLGFIEWLEGIINYSYMRKIEKLHSADYIKFISCFVELYEKYIGEPEYENESEDV